MSGRLRIGIVGAGAIARTHVEAIRALPTVELVGVADVAPAAARALVQGTDTPCFDDHMALVRGARCDAVIVCTPPATHAQICLDLLDARVAVLCEKPLCLDVRSAERMIDTADKHGLVLTMASKFRYVEDVERAKKMVDSGELGQVVLFENAFTSHVAMSGRWNADARLSGGGVLIDNGTHSVDLIRYFLGPIAEVQAIEGKRVQPLAVEDSVTLFVRSRSGVMGTIDLSWSINKELDDFIQIYGSTGNLRIGWRRSRARVGGAKEWADFGRGYDKVGCFVRQLENFQRAVAGTEPLRITPVDALASVHVIDAAYRSLRGNHWVPVDVEAP
jgi:predicted dehydrogenase